MMKSGSMLCLNKFYPEKDLKIVDIGQQKDKIVIRMSIPDDSEPSFRKHSTVIPL